MLEYRWTALRLLQSKRHISSALQKGTQGNQRLLTHLRCPRLEFLPYAMKLYRFCSIFSNIREKRFKPRREHAFRQQSLGWAALLKIGRTIFSKRAHVGFVIFIGRPQKPFHMGVLKSSCINPLLQRCSLLACLQRRVPSTCARCVFDSSWCAALRRRCCKSHKV